MFTDPLTLFDQTIENLEMLAAVLKDELDELVHTEPNRDGALAYRAAHTRIGTLLPALRAARLAQELGTRTQQRPFCLNCE